MPGGRRFARSLAVISILLVGCSSGEVDPTGDGYTLQVGEPVVSASAAPLGVVGSGRALAAQVADDGSIVVATTAGVHVVEPESAGSRVVVPFEPGGSPSMVAVSPGGGEVAVVAGDPQSIQVYETEGGTVTRSWSVALGVTVEQLWFEPVSGRLVVSTSSGPVLLEADGAVGFDSSGESIAVGRLDSLPDGTIVGAITDTTDLLVLRPGGEVERRTVQILESERLEDIRVAPSGGLIAVSASSGGDELERRHRVIVLDAEFNEVGSIDTGLRLEASNWALTDELVIAVVGSQQVAWSTDGNERGRAETSTLADLVEATSDAVIVVGQDGSIHRWDGAAPPVSLSGGGIATLFQTVDVSSGSITTVDLFGRIEVRRVGGELVRSEDAFAIGELTSLGVSPDGGMVAVGSTVGTLRVLDPDLALLNDVAAAEYGTRVDAVAFDPRRGGLVTGLSERVASEAFDDTVTAWSDELTERFRALGDIADVPGCAFFNARLRFDPTGDQLVAASHDFGVSVLDPVTGELLDELPGSATIVDLAFSPDGAVLVVTHDDGVIDVWDNSERSLLSTYRPSQPGVSAIALLPDSDAMVVADLTGALSVIDVMTGETFLVLDGAVARTRSIALSPDGALVAAPTPDGAIGFWSTDSGAHVASAPGHVGEVTALAFAPDGSRLYSASDDGTVRSWSVSTER